VRLAQMQFGNRMRGLGQRRASGGHDQGAPTASAPEGSARMHPLSAHPPSGARRARRRGEERRKRRRAAPRAGRYPRYANPTASNAGGLGPLRPRVGGVRRPRACARAGAALARARIMRARVIIAKTAESQTCEAPEQGARPPHPRGCGGLSRRAVPPPS
jgi:hypothetical protein